MGEQFYTVQYFVLQEEFRNVKAKRKEEAISKCASKIPNFSEEESTHFEAYPEEDSFSTWDGILDALDELADEIDMYFNEQPEAELAGEIMDLLIQEPADYIKQAISKLNTLADFTNKMELNEATDTICRIISDLTGLSER